VSELKEQVEDLANMVQKVVMQLQEIVGLTVVGGQSG
jgi:hypothetical protein